MNNKFGFIPSYINEEEHYMLGDGFLSAQVHMPEGHGWGNLLPEKEVQNKNGVETMNCTVYGTLNALEAIGKKQYGVSFQNKLSERHIGIIAGTTKYGNDPHHVAEVIRKISGAIPEVFLPFDASITTWEGYYSPRPIRFSLFKVGYSWMKKYTVKHDWVYGYSDIKEMRQRKMKEALKYSPLGASGFAWSQHPDGLYYSDGMPNHWFVVYDFVDGVKWLVFDSYDNTKKELDWNYEFGQCKRYSLTKSLGADEELGVGTFETVVAYIKYLFTK